MFKKDVIDMVKVDDLRDEGTLREFLHSLDHWTMIDLLEEQIINNVFDLATDEEVKDWLENKDPITNYRKRLLDYNIDEKVISDIENKIKQEVEEATEISKSSPIPDTKEIFTDVWADGGYEWHN